MRFVHSSSHVVAHLTDKQQGETVVDLGSGSGIDVFLAARKVGSSGKAIGVDMTKVCMPSALRIKMTSNARTRA